MLEFRKTWHLVRDFLFSIVNKEFLIFLFFLALSGVFWLLMALNETYEREYAIPVSLTGVPRKVVVTGDLEDTVRVTIRDKGFSLAAYDYWKKLRPLEFKFSSYAKEKTGKGMIPIADAQKLIYQQLFGSSRITAIKPDKLGFYFNYGISKMVPVRLEGKVTPGESYYITRTEFMPNRVRIYATKSILDSIKYISTVETRINNLTDTVEQRVALNKVKGVKIIPQTVSLRIYPDILTEYSIEVPITTVNVPEGKVLRTFPTRAKVKCIVGASMVRSKSINIDDFLVEADFSEISGNASDKCNLYLRKAPHNVSHPHLETNQVDYLIEQQ